MKYAFTVTTPGIRCDSFLAAAEPKYSRSFWATLCDQGAVQVNGQTAKPSRKLAQDDRVEAEVPDTPDFSNQTLPVLYEDDDVLVLNKPAGMLTHAKGAISHEFTVAEFARPRTTDGTDTNRPGIVHRLDRGTSGVIIAAKHTQAKRWLQKQFSARKVKKTYIALVQGRPKEPTATLQLPIERNPRKPQTFRVSASGKPAETAYRTLQEYPQATLLQLEPHTGRTHQLRVHMQYIGCPIVGDELYGTPNKKLGRLFLHAASLELTLPNRIRKIFTAPLPPELQKYIENLGMNDLLLHPRTRAELTALLRDTPHALLFVAPHGTGKRAVAQAWAQEFASAEAISILEPDEKGTIGIDAARSLYQQTRARQAGHQVVIIDHAGAMTTEAQNAFLKLLEEPRAGLTFILTAPNYESLLPTILSRVQVVSLQPLNQQALAAHIATIQPALTPQEVQQLLFVAQGRPAVLSRMLHDEQTFAAHKQIMQRAKFLLSAPVYERLVLVQEMSKDRAAAIATLEAMAHMLALQLRRTSAAAQLALAQSLQTALGRLQQNGNVRAQLTHFFLSY